MFGQTRLNEWRARKELLLVQADAQRRLIALDAQNAAQALQWVESAHRTWQQVKPMAWLAAPVAGFYLGRHGCFVWRWGVRLFKTWSWISGVRRARV